MKDFKLNDEDMQSLKASLLSFVKRVSAGIGSTPEEVHILPVIVGMLLGMSTTTGSVVPSEEVAESDCEQESENSGTWQECECGCSQCLLREKRCPSLPKEDIREKLRSGVLKSDEKGTGSDF